MKITFPHMGTAVLVLQDFFRRVDVDFVVVPRDQSSPPPGLEPRRLGWMPAFTALERKGARSWLDMPPPLQDVYYNPLARDWNHYRESQVFNFLKTSINSDLRRRKLGESTNAGKARWNSANLRRISDDYMR